jgi:hypothetical protein
LCNSTQLTPKIGLILWKKKMNETASMVLHFF